MDEGSKCYPNMYHCLIQHYLWQRKEGSGSVSYLIGAAHCIFLCFVARFLMLDWFTAFTNRIVRLVMAKAVNILW